MHILANTDADCDVLFSLKFHINFVKMFWFILTQQTSHYLFTNETANSKAVFQTSCSFATLKVTYYLLGFTAQRMKVCRTLGPTACLKIKWQTCLKKMQDMEKSMIALKPAVIQFTLEHL